MSSIFGEILSKFCPILAEILNFLIKNKLKTKKSSKFDVQLSIICCY